MLGIREGHDVVDSAIANATRNSVSVSSSEATATANDPYLSVTYELPAPPDTLYVGYPSAQSGSANPTAFAYSTPFFSAVNRNGEAVDKYQVQLTLSTDTGFASPIWNPISPAISFGSEYSFNSASTEYISATKLDDTHALIAYRDIGNNTGTAVVATVSGSTISYGSKYVFGGRPYSISVTALSSTTALIAYREWANNYYGTAIIATVSGSTSSRSSRAVWV